MASNSSCNLSAGIMHTWCLGLLLLASLSASQARYGAYGEAEALGSYGYGHGGYGYAASETNAPAQDVGWVDQLQHDMRRLLEDDPLVQPTASFVPDPDSTPIDSDKSSGTDIIPAPVPTTNSWDSATAQNWEDWFEEHFGSATPADAGQYSHAGAYGYSTSVGQYGYSASEGSYTTPGTYHDYKSNTAYIPAVIQDDMQQQSRQEHGPGVIPDTVSSSNSGTTYTAVNLSQIQPAQKPAIGGISRGRGTAIRQSQAPVRPPGQQQPEAANALRIDVPIHPVSPAGKVPGRALMGFGRKLRIIAF